MRRLGALPDSGRMSERKGAEPAAIILVPDPVQRVRLRLMNRNPFVHCARLILCGAGIVSAASHGDAAVQAPYTYVHHTVSTSVPAAQFAFDRGLTLVFAYDSDEAEQAFREAARLDPSLAMAWWGIALAVGPNINNEPEPKSTLIAADSIARAKLLASQHATVQEREYIDALSVRYSSDPKPDFDKLAVAYRDAMRALVGRNPNDADATALYAESIMDLHPWMLWSVDGKPAPDTLELVALLENGLHRHPEHIGLMHYYIHAVEASNDPARALAVARRLAALPMEPAAAHLVHMPAHIYLRVGDWPSAIEANEHAVHHALDYRLSSNPKQERACSHCVDFLTYAYMMDGSETKARTSAHDYQELSKDPTNAIAVLVRFHEWDDLLAFPEPATELKPSAYHNSHARLGFWHFGRGLAFAAKGRAEPAESELNALLAEAALVPPAPEFGEALDVEHVLDKLAAADNADTVKICTAVLRARIAETHGQLAQATEFLREAVRIQDAMPYGEPPSWPYPIRESLGAMLLKQNSAAEAEATFRDGLIHSPHDPRLLLGVAEALQMQGREVDAVNTRKEFQAAWTGNDAEIKVNEL
jgi:tetratricopeptide (TPR) repeat protein